MFNTWNQPAQELGVFGAWSAPPRSDASLRAGAPSPTFPLIAARAACRGGLQGLDCASCDGRCGGLQGLGGDSDYVKAGSVIWYRVLAQVQGYGDVLQGSFEAAIAAAINGHPFLKGATVDYSRLPFFSGELSVTVRTTGDFGHLTDVVSVIQGALYNYTDWLGNQVEFAPAAAQFGFQYNAATSGGTASGGTPPAPQKDGVQAPALNSGSRDSDKLTTCPKGYRWVDEKGCQKDHGWFGNLMADVGLTPTPTTIASAAAIFVLLGVVLIKR